MAVCFSWYYVICLIMFGSALQSVSISKQSKPKAFALGFPFQNISLSWEKRVDDLVSRLTLDEVVQQTAARYNHPTPEIDRLGIKPYTWIAECLRGYADQNATAFPQAIGLGASFSTELLFQISEAISKEVRAIYNEDVKKGRHGDHGLSCFSPVINIARHPLWGRNQETYGEDPYLSSELVRQFVHGLQGNHSRYLRANAGCKHFDVHGGPEDIPVSRLSFDAQVSERDLHMTFLPQFKACVEAGSYSIMCSYNRLNGVPACANAKLLTDILRKQWRFKGYVVSDEGAINFIVTKHKWRSTAKQAAVASVKAGCNLELVNGMPYFYSLATAVLDGDLLESEVRQTLKAPMYTRMRLGEFDPVSMNPYTRIDRSVVLSDAHRELAVQAALKSFVLLKNLNRLLPLRKRYGRIAIVGPMANNTEQLFGDYAASPDRRFVQSPLVGLKGLANETRYASGCNDNWCATYNETEIQMAVKKSQLVIVCLGTGQIVETEGRDRSELDLPGSQLQLLKDAIFYSREAPLVLLLFNAGPLDVTFAQQSDEVDTIVACFLPAQATGAALYRMFTMSSADAVPAGRLPMTWPAQLHQVPPITNYTMEGRTYRYSRGEPLYPFGYGLSYSKFRYTSLSVKPTKISAGESVNVTVGVLNRGPYDADEVVQVYMSWTNVSVPVPKWQLCGFKRQMMKVNQPASVSFIISPEQMSVWFSANIGFRIPQGEMIVYAGGQQPYQRSSNVGSNELKAVFTIT